MRYVLPIREIIRRIQHWSAVGEPLDGLQVRLCGEWRVNGDKDLPRITIIDFDGSEQNASCKGTLSMFLQTRTKHGFVSMNPSDPKGLIDWLQLVLDAIELRIPTENEPSVPDPRLCVRKDAASPWVATLPSPLTFSFKMAEVTDTSFTMQIDLSLAPVKTQNATRSRPPELAGIQ